MSFPLLAQVKVSATLNPSSTGITIPRDFIGISYEKTNLSNAAGNMLFDSSNTTLINLFATANIRSFRIGANGVDKSTYVDKPRDSKMAVGQFGTTDIDKLFGFIKKVNCKVLYGVNLGVYNPSLAAAEAKYVAKSHLTDLTAFEIGNEPNWYAGAYRDASYDVTKLIPEYSAYVDAIKAVVPQAKFSGPGASSHNTTKNWMPAFTNAMKGKIAFLPNIIMPVLVRRILHRINWLYSFQRLRIQMPQADVPPYILRLILTEYPAEWRRPTHWIGEETTEQATCLAPPFGY